MEKIPILTFLTFLPSAGALSLLLINKQNHFLLKLLGFFYTLINFAASIVLFLRFDSTTYKMQFVEKIPWIKELEISYYVGIDGISMLLIVLTTLLSVVALLSSWNAIQDKVKEYVIYFLFLETGIIGVFTALDLILFFIFWEAMLIPMYFLIGIWGGPRRIYATIKFFIYTTAGSMLMLVGIFTLYFLSGKTFGHGTFDLLKLYNLYIPLDTQKWLFLAFFLAFAIKVPMFPFHTWLPDAHVEAPTAGSAMLAGILLKMGTYGFLRFAMPLFPQAAANFTPLMCTLAIIGIIYGALVAMVQPDIKKLVAYSSVSHLGFVLLGLFALNMQSVEGSIIQMINHGLSTGALFLLVGMIYERRHTRMIEDFGGLSKQMPLFSAMFLIITLSSIGLPGLNGFVGEFLIILGTFHFSKIYAVLASSGVILSAIYMLWMFQRVMYGELKNPENQKLKDISIREIAVLLPLIVFIFWIGIYSHTFLRTMDVSVEHLIKQIKIKQAEVYKPNPNKSDKD